MKRKNLISALLVAGLLVATPMAVDAAGLGKLKVISALGATPESRNRPHFYSERRD